jgi:hypothetical protein
MARGGLACIRGRACSVQVVPSLHTNVCRHCTLVRGHVTRPRYKSNGSGPRKAQRERELEWDGVWGGKAGEEGEEIMGGNE